MILASETGLNVTNQACFEVHSLSSLSILWAKRLFTVRQQSLLVPNTFQHTYLTGLFNSRLCNLKFLHSRNYWNAFPSCLRRLALVLMCSDWSGPGLGCFSLWSIVLSDFTLRALPTWESLLSLQPAVVQSVGCGCRKMHQSPLREALFGGA